MSSAGRVAVVAGALDDGGQRGSRRPALGGHVLAHGGEQWAHPLGDGVVVEADDRKVIRDGEPERLGSQHDAVCGGIGEAEDRRRSVVALIAALEQQCATDPARLLTRLSLADNRWTDAGWIEGVEPAEHSLRRDVAGGMSE